jgi:hypothetical protein
MLRKELRESDIPGRTTIRKRIEEVFQEHLKELECNLRVRLCVVFFDPYRSLG